MQIDIQAIIDEILAANVVPTAREAAAPLIESWIEHYWEEDAKVRTFAVECGFHVWVDDNILLIGVQDRIAEDTTGLFGCEWKTAKEPKKNRDGSDSAWWNEGKWLQELVNGPQLAIYALAMHRGKYYSKGKSDALELNVDNPRILVRAAVKSNPPRFWPTDPSEGFFQFPNEMFKGIEDAIRVRAAMIRAARKSQFVPWQLPGDQCFAYGRECQFADRCTKHNYITEAPKFMFNPSDPAFELALPHVPKEKLADPDLVILSASAYKDGTGCMEKFRILTGGLGPKDESLALDTGTAFHAGAAALYRQYLQWRSRSTI